MEYGRKPYLLGKDETYQDMMRGVANRTVWNTQMEKQSEFEKPYLMNSPSDYSAMQHNYQGTPTDGVDRHDMTLGGVPYNPCAEIIWNLGNPTFEETVWLGEIHPKTKYWWDQWFYYGCGDMFYTADGCSLWTDADTWTVGETIILYMCVAPSDKIVNITIDTKFAWISHSESNQKLPEGGSFEDCGSWEGSSYIKLYLTVSASIPASVSSIEICAETMLGEECCVTVDKEVCNCTGISIGYTTQQMAVDEVQTLTATGYWAGCTYTWALSGGGELSASEGTSITYTAPSSNANCTNNATITLSVEGSTCDTLEIAVNAYGTDATVAYIKADDSVTIAECTNPQPGQWTCGRTLYVYNYNCKGELLGSHSSYGWSTATWVDSCDECYAWLESHGYTVAAVLALAVADGHAAGSVEDVRTEQMRIDGCCPAAVL